MKYRFSPLGIIEGNLINDYHTPVNVKTIAKSIKINRKQLSEEYKKIDFNRTCIDVYLSENSSLIEVFIQKEQYAKIEKLVTQEYPQLVDHIEDFAVVVAYMNAYKIGGIKYQALQVNKDVKKQQKEFELVENYLRKIEHEPLDIQSIKITAKNSGVIGATIPDDLVITNELLIKILLNGFAHELYALYYDYDEENWNCDITSYSPKQSERKKKGRDEALNTPYKEIIAEAFFNMLHNENAELNADTDDDANRPKIVLFVKLLDIAEAEEKDSETTENKIVNRIYRMIDRKEIASGINILRKPIVEELQLPCNLRNFILYHGISGRDIKDKISDIFPLEGQQFTTSQLKWHIQMKQYNPQVLRQRLLT